MSDVYLAQVSFQGASGLPEDRFVNTFHASFGNVLGANDLANFAGLVADFYNALAAGQTTRIAEALSTRIQRGSGKGHTLKIYRLADPKPRTPVYQFSDLFLGGATPSANSLPEEVAVCLSYRAALVSGANAARRRGRIFVGPLNGNISTGGADPRPTAAFQTDLIAAGQKLFGPQPTLSAAARIGIYSRFSGPTGGVLPVNQVWVDNAFDTVRRRGIKATARATGAVA